MIVAAAVVAGVMAWVAPPRVWRRVAARLTSAVPRPRLPTPRRRGEEPVRRDLPLFVDLVALGVGAGLSFRAAFLQAADAVHPSLRDEAIRSMRGTGDGENVARLISIARRAAESGASVAVELAAYADELRASDREAALARLRRLPIRLLFPLALLILPGFLLMALGPTLSAALQRLGL